MNFLMVAQSVNFCTFCSVRLLHGIYQLFYTEKSGPDKGSLYQLRGDINRRDVSGPKEVVCTYRPHYNFISAAIVGDFLEAHDMENLESTPKNMPAFSLMTTEQQTQWTMESAKDIMTRLQITDAKYLDHLRGAIDSLDRDDRTVKNMFDGTKYTCAQCGKTYIREAWFRIHLCKVHGWQFSEEATTSMSPDNPISSFLRMSLLLLDTVDAHKWGDGDRIFMNAKFEWLYAGSLGHTKYKLWLWRMLAYDMAILSERESYEYRWNTTVNVKGGEGKNIPNDNLVEIHVHNIKSQLQTQGANKSFNSAYQAAMTTEAVDGMKQVVMKSSGAVQSSRKKPQVDLSKDIL